MSIIALTLMSAAITVEPVGLDQPRQVVVKYDDLNLTTIDGREVLDQRLDRAVRMVCGTVRGEPLYMRMVIRKCATTAAKQVAPQRDLAVAQSGVKLASRN